MDVLALLPAGAPVLGGAVVLGLVHGAEPGHGWPIAAAYALDREPKWSSGLVASVLLGLGHLVSSLAVVAGFFLAKSALNLDRLNEPLSVLGISIGGPVAVVAGVLLIGLGVREYRRGGESGRSHGHHHDHNHDLSHESGHDHPHVSSGGTSRASTGSWVDRLRARLPGVDGSHAHPTPDDLDREGLLGIVWTAFVLGFVHEEEFEIIGLCMGSSVCLELMLIYAVAVLFALVGLTMLLIAGYYRYEERVERYAAHFPTISAAVLVVMGLGFVLGVL